MKTSKQHPPEENLISPRDLEEIFSKQYRSDEELWPLVIDAMVERLFQPIKDEIEKFQKQLPG